MIMRLWNDILIRWNMNVSIIIHLQQKKGWIGRFLILKKIDTIPNGPIHLTTGNHLIRSMQILPYCSNFAWLEQSEQTVSSRILSFIKIDWKEVWILRESKIIKGIVNSIFILFDFSLNNIFSMLLFVYKIDGGFTNETF